MSCSGSADLHLQSHMPCHACHMIEFHHPLVTVRQPDRPGHMIIDRIVDFLCQTAIKLQSVALHVHDCKACREVRTVACSMPGGPGSQLVLFQQDTIAPAILCQMVERGHANDATANDHNACCGWYRHGKPQ